MLGASPIAGLWLATGHHRNGVLLAATTAQLVSQAVLGSSATDPEAEALLRAFRWDRFS